MGMVMIMQTRPTMMFAVDKSVQISGHSLWNYPMNEMSS